MRSNRERRGTIAIMQRHLLVGPLRGAEEKDPLPTSDRHPAKGLPGRRCLGACRVRLLSENCGNSCGKLEIAGCPLRWRQCLQFALDETGIDLVGANGWVRHKCRQEGN